MIQRIQSIFWLLALMLVIVFILTSIHTIDTIVYHYSLAGFALLLNIFAILSFKNRRRQLVLSYLAMLCILGLLALITVHNQSPSTRNILTMAMLAGAIVLNLIANFFTRKDIKLINESSRLR